MAEFSLPREISRLSRGRIMFTRIKISRWLARIPGLDILSHGTFSIVLPPLIASVARSTELPPTHTRVMDERRPRSIRNLCVSSRENIARRQWTNICRLGDRFHLRALFLSRKESNVQEFLHESSPNWTWKILR